MIYALAFVALLVGSAVGRQAAAADNNNNNNNVRRLIFEANNIQSNDPGGNTDYNGYRTLLGYSDAQIQAELYDALEYYHLQFGVPNDTATYVPNFGLIVPGYGVVTPISFNTEVDLVLSKPHYAPSKLGFAEVPFFITNSFTYGGRYGQFLTERGYTTAMIASSAEFFSYGFYVVTRDRNRADDATAAEAAADSGNGNGADTRIWRVRTRFPASNRPNGIFSEITEVVDQQWGVGETSTTIQVDKSPSDSKYLVKMAFDFAFPGGINRFTFSHQHPNPPTAGMFSQ